MQDVVNKMKKAKKIIMKTGKRLSQVRFTLPRLGQRKAQFKIQQMAFMLIALVAFFALVGIFVLGFNISQLKGTASLLEEKNAGLLAMKLADSPEFSCGNAFDEISRKTGCVDADKLMMVKQDINKYRNFWGVYGIEVRTVYPKQETEKACTLSNYPNCNVIKLLENSSQGYDYSNFVSLCRKEKSLEGAPYDKCNIAEIIIRYKGAAE